MKIFKMNDNYIHIDSNVIYVVENIPGPVERNDEYQQLLNSFNSQYANCCECNQICIESSCKCMFISGGANYSVYTPNGQIMLNYDKDFNVYPIIECNTLCQCSRNCGNRLVQRGPIEHLIIKTCKTKCKGRGLFTEHFIPKGTFICEYAGEIITRTEALKRHQANVLKNNMNYIFCLNEHSNGILTQTIVDPSIFGNIGRYINHSCDPNCQIIPVRVDSIVPKLAIFSCKDILCDTEITFDYGVYNEASLFSTDVSDRKQCLCGTLKCQGLMPYDVY